MITDKSIEVIAEQLGMATGQIYEIFVAAQPIIAMLQLLCVAFVIIAGIVGYRLSIVFKWECEPITAAFMFAFVTMSMSIILYDSMRCYLLPEYSAIVKLMGMVFGGAI